MLLGQRLEVGAANANPAVAEGAEEAEAEIEHFVSHRQRGENSVRKCWVGMTAPLPKMQDEIYGSALADDFRTPGQS
jgi:hypothetical protein